MRTPFSYNGLGLVFECHGGTSEISSRSFSISEWVSHTPPIRATHLRPIYNTFGTWHLKFHSLFHYYCYYYYYCYWLRYNHILDKGERILCHSTISLVVSQRNQEKEKSSQYIWHWHYIGKCASQNLRSNFFVSLDYF